MTRKWYFVFDRNASALAQMLIGFDPVTGLFDQPVFLPVDPQKLAISSDGNALEVAMRNVGELRRVGLLTNQIVHETSLSRWQEIQAKNESVKERGGIRFMPHLAMNIENNQIIGTFPSVAEPFEPELAVQRYYQVIYADYFRLRIIDLNTFRLLDDVPLPIPHWSFGALSRWGENGFLLRGPQGFVVWRSRLVPYGPATDLRAEVSFSTERTTTNSPFTLTATVTNAGPNPATNVMMRLWLPAQAALLNASGSTGVVSTNNSILTLSLNRLAVLGNATIIATLRTTNLGVLLATSHATSQSVDTNWANDVAVDSIAVAPIGGWPAPDSAITLPLAVHDLIYEPVSELLFASVGSYAGARGNSVVSIDPVTGLIRDIWFVGSDPGRLVASDDGQFLYVSMTGAESVSRMRLADEIIDQQFSVNIFSDWEDYASDMAVQPGTSWRKFTAW